MIPITELRYFADTQPAYRILKPWWDVFTDYISIVMLMIAVFGGTLQVTQDKMICLPCKWVVNQTCEQLNVSVPLNAEPKGIQYDLDRHQYNYVDAVCYENKLHWFAKYFPYLVLLHTLIFLACSNFWFKFPRTSSKLEHFVSILLKCFDSPWTTRALSETVVEESDPKPAGKMNGSMDKKTSSVSDQDVEASVPMLQRTKSRIEQGIVDRSETGVLEKKEGEQAKALFEKVLKLELIPDVTIPPIIAQLCNLREMWLYHTPAKIEAPALAFLRENLKSLHIKFTDIKEIPLWIYSLKNLSELHLTGNLSADNNRFIVIDGLRELKRLKVLRLKSNLTKLPQVVTDVGVHLQKLSINNEGTKLMVLNSLKKMVNLTELELLRCDLERIPHSIFSLHNLQEIDLKDNNLKTIEEIISFQHLHRLVCLKLWYNQIAYIPIQIGTLTNLERLYLNRNKIEKIPAQLFFCRKLRYLDLSHNNLTSIPADIGFLQNLQYFAVTANRIETLPPELFQCKKLRTLNLGNNCLTVLPSRFGELTGLMQLELRGNRLEGLPVELSECRLLKRSGLIVEEDLFNTLPPEVKEQLWRTDKEQA
ncbi:volume-regulated anion channel subunit LRRC8A-like [Sinocyclocheilus grahami]|uniref:volume-regulated anion channel subunit LRRC8A-like n=1 Tax=Sinocyclocheilus grahami TaxID=75366 RepID=UPI0007ACE6D0|nr:PREDICTED: volume-regulated anion channel subunit LRRC8A-like [Sinocyclocheilus grahami]